MADRFAFLVGSYEYAPEPKLQRLQGPLNDISALAAVLGDPQIGGFVVQTSINEAAATVAERVEGFLSERTKDDVALLYFSGHGVKDEDGKLYFAMANTRLSHLFSTALKAADLNDRLQRSRARQKMLLLDCCYSGAFARGMTMRGGNNVGTHDHFDGRGLAVLTASDAMQYSFEEDRSQQFTGEAVQSIFTRVLVEGLQSGSADRDGDGIVTFDELYDYVHCHVGARTPSQTPRKWSIDQQGRLVVARVAVTNLKAAPLPPDLLETVNDRRPWVRQSAIVELLKLLVGDHPGRALAARQALEGLSRDDSDSVKVAARQVLQQHPPGSDGVVPAATAEDSALRAEPPHPSHHVKREAGPAQHRKSSPEAASAGIAAAQPGSSAARAGWRALPQVARPKLRTLLAVIGAVVVSGALTIYLTNRRLPVGPIDPPVGNSGHKTAVGNVVRDQLADGSEGPAMVIIPAGHFLMGSAGTEAARLSDEGPQHQVSVESFALSRTEVTFAEYDRFAAATGRTLPNDAGWGRGTRPVINVSWRDATAYVQWLSAQTAAPYRLPSEAEWEYAARAGTQAAYGVGSAISSQQANFGQVIGKTQPVGSYPANAFAVHDMHGNVWEWVQDCWHETYDQAPEIGTAWFDQSNGECTRVMRGASWIDAPQSLRSAFRGRDTVIAATRDVGFRVAKSL